MDMIIPVKGAVKFPITIDPTVWIFDDRKVDIDEYFSGHFQEVNQEAEYTDVTSKQWSREITEGSVFPPTLKSEKKYERTKLLTNSYAIPLESFILNAEPAATATTLVVESTTGDKRYPLNTLSTLLVQFSKEGKPLKEDGPVYILHKDGSNIEAPLTHVSSFRVE
ncbi:peptidyl-prolyl cis-trans isomerase [Chryseomicrobium sp. FSL W7-1435]|uniref:peptidyl-prolyl cis-trans isomerase n=1 Tax=Chryseomicrobium sp. FSL W7-1435 TaxID=2921704 RepID=UPI00315AD9DC